MDFITHSVCVNTSLQYLIFDVHIYKTWNMLLAAQNLKAFVKLEQIYCSNLFLISSFFYMYAN